MLEFDSAIRFLVPYRNKLPSNRYAVADDSDDFTGSDLSLGLLPTCTDYSGRLCSGESLPT